MKQRVHNPVIPDYTPKKQASSKEQEVKLDFTPCENPECKKPIEAGYFGRWNNGGVCSGACNAKMAELRKAWYDSQPGKPASNGQSSS